MQAGRALLGGERELVMACFVACRCGSGLCTDSTLGGAELKSRAAAARTWLASISVAGQVRLSAVAVIDASGAGDAVTVARCLAHLLMLASAQLDEPAFAEMRELVDELAHESSEFEVQQIAHR